MNFFLKLFAAASLILLHNGLIAQTGRGKVVGIVNSNQEQQPLNAVTVTVLKNSKVIASTVSDSTGKFAFENLEAGSYDFTFSHIGYKAQALTGSTVRQGETTSLLIKLLESSTEMEDVIVVGYGTRKRQDVTGSVTRANLQLQKQSPNSNVISSLRGTVAGLTIGQTTRAGTDPTIIVRGRNSISGTTSPLIVVDGLIYRGTLTSINPSDIASIDLLKDASAAAVYGSQAANGVVLITTKTGTAAGDKINVDYSGSYSIQKMTNKQMRPASGAQFLQKIGDWYLSESRDPNDPTKMNPAWDPTTKLSAVEAANAKRGYEANWWDLMTNPTPRIQSHYIGLNGRTKKLRFYMGYGYFDQTNLIKNDDYRRNSIRLNLDVKPANWLSLGAQTSLSINDYSGVSPAFSDIMFLKPYTVPYDTLTGKQLQFYPTTTTPTALEILRRSRDLETNLNFIGNFYASVDIPGVKGLNYRVNFGNNYIYYRRFNFNAPTVEATAYKTYMTDYFQTLDNILTYKREFGRHGVDVTLLYGGEINKHDGSSTTANGITNWALGYDRLDVGDPARLTVSNDLSVLPWKEQALYQMGRASYTFDRKYILTGTLRRDGFSGFSEKNKWALFPSIAFAWRAGEEDFLKSVKSINDLKLRLSYGASGNRTVGRYQTLSQMTVGLSNGYLYGSSGGAQLGSFLSQLPNPDLKWETTTSFNAGIDFSLLDNRLFGSLDIYFSNTKNLLNSRATPSITGFNTFLINIGKIQNRGQELNITGVPVKNKDFSWEIGVNFFRNRNKVLDIDGTGKNLINATDPILSYFIGQPYGVVYDYKITGIYQIGDKIPATLTAQGFKAGQYKIEDVNGDGIITTADKQILGKLDPSYSVGISNNIKYKNFEFKFFINTIQGGKNGYLGAPGIMLQNPDNIRNNNGFVFDYWTPNNTVAKYRSIAAYTVNENLGPYMQRNFVRLQDVTLTYTFPRSLLKQLKLVKEFNVYVNAQNLVTLTKWDGWDPESNPPASQRSSTGLRIPGGLGLDQNGYPVMKNYSLGINLTF